MYENQTFENIMNRMLSEVVNTVDKREGSIIYDTLSPASIKFSEFYADLDINLNLCFADTASGMYLDLLANTLGITPRKAATKSIRKGVFTDVLNNPFDVPIGSRYSIENLNFTAISKISLGVFEMECETPGEIGNTLAGTLVPIEYIPSLGKAELTDIITPGTEEESDDSLRARYLERARKPITSGNVYHYEMWAKEVPGIGGAKCYPTWNGPGTVKVVVVDTDKRAPTPGKVEEVQEYIESVMPVNVDLTVAGATELPINVTATLTLQSGTTTSAVANAVQASLVTYLENIALAESVVRISRIANLILDVDGVIDYADLKLNGSPGNIVIPDDSVAIAGTVNFS